MKIYNTYTEKKEELNLKEKIGIYVCGVTPYDTTHLGHAFTFIVYDTLVRYLRFLDAKVTYVQNVTDIDDDILIRSHALNMSWDKLGKKETEKHIKNMDTLNALRPDYYPKATENISQMVSIIKKLVPKKLAYVKGGNVYFSVSHDKNFGKLSKFGYRAMLEIADDRGNFPLDPNKIDPLDFVLWQAQKPNEPSWDSPWGKGRPGWHIECSAMSMRFLGPTVTIHGGGSDLIFPHHESEIAQSENFTNQKFVKIWMHAAMVFCDGKKMSKSLGNMIFVSDLVKKYSSNTIRILLLSHHWQIPWNWDEKELDTAQKTANTLESFAKKSNHKKSDIKKNAAKFFSSLENNFDTPGAIKELLNFTKHKTATNQEVVYACGQILGLKF